MPPEAVDSVSIRYCPWGQVIYDHNRRAALDRINSFLERGQLIFVYLPDWTSYTNFYSPGKATRSEVLALVRDLGTPLVDIMPRSRLTVIRCPSFPFRRPGHYNEMGHRVVAEEVLKALSRRGERIDRGKGLVGGGESGQRKPLDASGESASVLPARVSSAAGALGVAGA